LLTFRLLSVAVARAMECRGLELTG
jgi:hypothetical protein